MSWKESSHTEMSDPKGHQVGKESQHLGFSFHSQQPLPWTVSLEEPRTILTPYPLRMTVCAEPRFWIFQSFLDPCSGILDDFASLLQLGCVPETELKISRLRDSFPKNACFAQNVVF